MAWYYVALLVAGWAALAVVICASMRRGTQVPYQAMIGPRKYIDGMEGPDDRYKAIPGPEARRREALAREALKGGLTVSPESVEIFGRQFEQAEQHEKAIVEPVDWRTTPPSVH